MNAGLSQNVTSTSVSSLFFRQFILSAQCDHQNAWGELCDSHMGHSGRRPSHWVCNHPAGIEPVYGPFRVLTCAKHKKITPQFMFNVAVTWWNACVSVFHVSMQSAFSGTACAVDVLGGLQLSVNVLCMHTLECVRVDLRKAVTVETSVISTAVTIC